MTTLYGGVEKTETKQPKSNLWYYLADNLQGMPNTIGTIAGFYKNYKDGQANKDIKGGDKYFHAKANANAGQHYDILPAVTLSVGKELYDIPNKASKGMTWGKNLKDSAEDIQADMYGLFQGMLHPFKKPQMFLRNRPLDLDYEY